MIEEVLPYIFAFMFMALFVWFGMCVKLFNSLKVHHPETYVKMGSPGLLRNNTLSNNILFIKFLFKKEWRKLNDKNIEDLGNIMYLFIIIYAFLFVVFVWLILNVISP